MPPHDLLELDRARAALAASEERLALVLKGSNDGWWDWDLVADRVYYAPRWWRMLGLEPDELPADSRLWHRRLHPADVARIDLLLERVFSPDGPEHVEVEFRLLHKLGHHVPILARGHLVRDAAGRALRISGTNTDLSARLQAEAARHQSDATQRALLDAMADGVFVAQDHRFVFANPALPAMLGHSAEGFLGLRFEQVVDPEFLTLWNRRFEQRIAGGADPPRHYELCFLTRDGKASRWVELRASRIDYQGRGAVLGIVRDIGDRKQSEAALRESEQRWKFALEGAGDGVFDWNMATREVVYSSRWKSMLGCTDDAIGHHLQEWRDRVHPDDVAPAQQALREHLAGRARQFRTEYRMRHRDGHWLPVLARGLVVARADDGQPLRLVGTHTDLSDRRKDEAERELLETRLREAQKMEAIGTLAGGVAHDFNNVLAGILGNVALARQDLSAGHPALASLEQIQKAGLRARSLVQQILAFSRRQPQQLASQALQPLVEETCALLRTTLPAVVSLEARLPAEPLHLLADATQIQQVLMNLCTNAWHALRGSSGRITVGVQALCAQAGDARGLAPGEHVHLWVGDDGCGMDAEARERIFEPFYTTKPVGQGTGLGLAVVHGIVTAHGGTIAVESEPGHGSTFHLYFARAAAPVAPAAAPLPALPAGGRGEHVLYIDDDEIMLLTVERLLQRAGYRVSAYADPRLAVEAVRRAPQDVDLVVTDLNMPGYTGLDVLRDVTALRAGLPVIISSGYLPPEMSAEAQRAGVRALLQKEHSVEELGPLVQQVLSR